MLYRRFTFDINQMNFDYNFIRAMISLYMGLWEEKYFYKS